MNDRSDATLVAAVLAGDKNAFCALVRRYQGFAYGVAVGMLSDFDLAQDVVQEAFLGAYRNLVKLKDPARFGGWLRGIVRHSAHRALREREHVRLLADRLRDTLEASEVTAPPDHLAAQAERRETVRRALERLDSKNREVVSLYYIDDLSYAEIADFLSVSRATVKGRLQRGRAQLREELRMVEDTFRENKLPEDFSTEIGHMLDAWAARGVEQKREIERLVEIGASAVEPLCQALRDPRPAVRRGAANALCAIGDPRALSPIWEAWMAARLEFRIRDLLAIRGAREALLRVLREGKRTEQWWALQVLSHATGDDEVFDNVHEVFRRPGGDRGGALLALCDIRPEAALSILIEALDDSNLRLRGMAAWAAVGRGLVPPIESCLNAFVEGVGWWGRLCAANLVLKHGAEGERILERVTRTGSHAERATAAMVLAREANEEAFEILKQELLVESRDRQWIKAVSRTLASRYPRQLAAWIESDLSRLGSIPDVMWALAESSAKQSEPTAERLLREGTPTIRTAALRILARHRGAAFLPELRRCMREGRPRKVAREAFRHMLRLGDAARPTAEEMLQSENWTERKAAVALLRRWGQLTSEHRAQAENDPHIAVRLAAKVTAGSAPDPTRLA